MNLQSELGSGRGMLAGGDAMSVFTAPEKSVTPFEFRMITKEDAEEMRSTAEAYRSFNVPGTTARGPDRRGVEASFRVGAEAARQQGYAEGESEGRRAARAEMEAEIAARVARERSLITSTVEQFRGARERYFVDVEQEVVKLALAIAARVLHREAQIDPLLLAGVVRVAMEKMADRSGVVVRVAGEDVPAWDGAFQAMEATERPRVVADARLARGECVLETTMGTVELGVKVQLEEIEKGFFDLLNHRPAQ
ncbi:MAG TPA: FliH/SctL family protein [Acidobacteriaceae bacterium]|nr:FliH/SctL family protein [Acidobacteriaceae bacterium]